MLKKIVLIGCALALGVAPLMAQEASPEPEPSQVVLMPPPDTDKPEDAGEPPADPEAVEVWITAIFHSMMDTDGNGELDREELRHVCARIVSQEEFGVASSSCNLASAFFSAMPNFLSPLLKCKPR